MHFKETVSILSLKYELDQIKNVKILLTYPLGAPLFENLIYPLKKKKECIQNGTDHRRLCSLSW